jgi:Arc/MetJ family transcription regulator
MFDFCVKRTTRHSRAYVCRDGGRVARVRTRREEGDTVAKVSISLDAELVVEVMVLAGIGSPQDAVEAVVRDYIARGHRTETRTDHTDHGLREVDAKPQEPQG